MAQTVGAEPPQIQLLGLRRTPEETSPEFLGKGHQLHRDRIARGPCHPSELFMWHRVNSEPEGYDSPDYHYWWTQHSGKALAVLLHHARYSPDKQHRDLKFFAQAVASYIGPPPDKSSWSSSMTDDGTPIELSWDWGTDINPPTIRYSVEPIGLHAGTPLDPCNLAVEPAFEEQLAHRLPGMRLELFHHFKSFFNSHAYIREQADAGDHKTNIFYAFDLAATEIVAKAYFFPKMRAQVYGQSNLDVILQAIRSIPDTTGDNLMAFQVFSDFSSDAVNKELEYEMLAIDLIPAESSRLKIYFRCRDTSFNSVINIMSLGGRARNPKLTEGFRDLQMLWEMLFGLHQSPDRPLGTNHHRTAGILFNVEFRTGDVFPVAKVYLPVRHYAASDEAVILGLSNYFQIHQRGQYMPDYIKAMNTLFSPQSMRARTGAHTYIGCSIRSEGTLRVVSYIKPQVTDGTGV